MLDSESGSLYALCRSWLRNGVPHEIQVGILPFFHVTCLLNIFFTLAFSASAPFMFERASDVFLVVFALQNFVFELNRWMFLR